jgi:hypothetical protein
MSVKALRIAIIERCYYGSASQFVLSTTLRVTTITSQAGTPRLFALRFTMLTLLYRACMMRPLLQAHHTLQKILIGVPGW